MSFPANILLYRKEPQFSLCGGGENKPVISSGCLSSNVRTAWPAINPALVPDLVLLGSPGCYFLLQHSPALTAYGGCVVVITIANAILHVNSKSYFLFDGYLILELQAIKNPPKRVYIM